MWCDVWRVYQLYTVKFLMLVYAIMALKSMESETVTVKTTGGLVNTWGNNESDVRVLSMLLLCDI